MKKYKIEMDGMSCNHCVEHVKNAFEECEAIVDYKVEINQAVVEGNISEDEVREIIDEEGYDVISIKEEY